MYWYFCIRFSLVECKSSKTHAVHFMPNSSSFPVVFLHHRRMNHQTLEFDRREGGKDEQMTVQGPSLPQLQNEGCRAEQFHSLLAPVNWGTALNSVLVPQVSTRSHLSPQPAVLPSSRCWIIQAARNVSKRKGSNSLTHSLLQFGPSAPKASSVSERVWSKPPCSSSFGVNQAFYFLSKDKATSLATNTLLL